MAANEPLSYFPLKTTPETGNAWLCTAEYGVEIDISMSTLAFAVGFFGSCPKCFTSVSQSRIVDSLYELHSEKHIVEAEGDTVAGTFKNEQ